MHVARQQKVSIDDEQKVKLFEENEKLLKENNELKEEVKSMDDENDPEIDKSMSEITEVKDLKASKNALLDETKQL